MIVFILIFAALILTFLAWILCSAAATGEHQADDLYCKWLMESGYGREDDSIKASL